MRADKGEGKNWKLKFEPLTEAMRGREEIMDRRSVREENSETLEFNRLKTNQRQDESVSQQAILSVSQSVS